MIRPQKQLHSDKNLLIVTSTLHDAVATPARHWSSTDNGYASFLDKAGIDSMAMAKISPGKHTVVASIDKPHERPLNCDAGITNVAGIYLSLYTADCIPLVVYSPNQKTVALIHVGYQAIATNLIATVVTAMQEKYHVNPVDCLAYLGPSICMSEYKHTRLRGFYKNQLFTQVGQESAIHHHGSKRYISIKRAAREQLNEQGVMFTNIETAPYCTAQESDLFPSHYRDRSDRHYSLLTIVGIKK